MSLFLPTATFTRINNVTVDTLNRLKAKAVFLDVDNTLAYHGSPEPLEGTLEWAQEVIKSGIEIVIISNNFKSRVEPFANKFNLPFVSFAQKPFPYSFYRAKQKLKNKNIKSKDCVVIGDQVFTDIVGANMSGMKSILLEPAIDERSFSFVIRRNIEQSIRKRIAFKKDVNGFIDKKRR